MFYFFIILIPTPDFPSFLLYLRRKSGVTFVRRCFRDDGGHLGHVTYTIYINFISHFPRRPHIEFGIDWPSGFREEDV